MSFSVTEPFTAMSLERRGQQSCLNLMGTAGTTKRRFPRIWVIPAALLCLALTSSAFGFSMIIPVTTNNLNQPAYIFSISTNAAQDGVSFHVTVVAKVGDIPSECTVGLCKVTYLKDFRSIESAKPAIRVALQKTNRVWKADFTVPRQSLRSQRLCCVFTEQQSDVVGGVSTPSCSATFYAIKLRDFLKP